MPADATVDGVKVIVARAAGFSDHNRIGLFNPTTSKTLKDRHAKVLQDVDVASTKELLVKDLGTPPPTSPPTYRHLWICTYTRTGVQIAWRTVFIVEYIGPLLIHPLMLYLRPYIYPWAPVTPLSPTQRLAFAMVMAHFAKRELETLFVHKFSASTMPAFNIFRNSFFYWALWGLLSAYALYSPTSLAATADEPLVDYAGLAIFALGEVCNAMVHGHLSSLRSTGGTERKIPTGIGFSIVTCPNYMFEVIGWVGAIVAARSWALALSLVVGCYYMGMWAKGKERAYRKEFGDKYKKKRYVMLPGII